MEANTHHFSGSMRGGGGEVSVCGGMSSIMEATLDGLNFGVRATITHNRETGKHFVRVYRTSGASESENHVFVAEFSEEGDEARPVTEEVSRLRFEIGLLEKALVDGVCGRRESLNGCKKGGACPAERGDAFRSTS